MTSREFLLDRIKNYDAVFARVDERLAGQHFIINVERVYSNRQGGESVRAGVDIEMVSAPPVFGSPTLEVGDRAIIFIKPHLDVFYEHSWLGHFLIEEIDGRLYAIYKVENMWNRSDIPMEIRNASRPDPKRPHSSAIKLDALEGYLIMAISRLAEDSSNER